MKTIYAFFKWNVLIAAMLLSGCSATTLRCGVTEDSTYVDIVNIPQDLAGQARWYAELCGFAYDDPRLIGD